MRASIVLALCLAALAARAETIDPEDDDPKCARGECRPFFPPPLDEDDPKLSLGFRRRWPVPHFELGYRYLSVADPYGGSLPMHLVEADAYPMARYFRLGFSVTGGASTRESAWMTDVGLSVGLQYPWRVTPFFDARFAAGVIGAHIVQHSVVSYELRPTLEAGIAVFAGKSFHFVAAVGWSHPIYGGVDARKVQNEINAGVTPSYDVHNLGHDTVTVRVGIGL